MSDFNSIAREMQFELRFKNSSDVRTIQKMVIIIQILQGLPFAANKLFDYN